MREPWESLAPKLYQTMGLLGFHPEAGDKSNVFVRGAWWGPLVSFSPRNLPRRIAIQPRGEFLDIDDRIALYGGVAGKADLEFLRSEFDDVVDFLRHGKVSMIDRASHAAEVSKQSMRISKKLAFSLLVLTVVSAPIILYVPRRYDTLRLVLEISAFIGLCAAVAQALHEFKNLPSPKPRSFGYEPDRLGLGQFGWNQTEDDTGPTVTRSP